MTLNLYSSAPTYLALWLQARVPIDYAMLGIEFRAQIAQVKPSTMN